MSHADERVGLERRLAGAFRAPEFDDARAERVLAAARTVEAPALRSRGGSRGVRFAAALAACAAVLVAAAVLPSVWSAKRGADSTAAPKSRGTATWQSAQSTETSVTALRHPHGVYSSVVRPPGTESLSTDHGLRLSVDVASASVSTGEPVVVRLTLTNVSGGTVRWDAFHFALSVSTTFQSDPRNPDGIYLGGFEGFTSPRSGPALTLRPGESTTTVLSTPLAAAMWQVVGGYRGDPGEPSGQAPTITVLAGPRPRVPAKKGR